MNSEITEAKTMDNQYKFDLKYNNCGVNGVCYICGAITDPATGLYIFERGSWREPCPQCAEKYAPDLWATVQYWQETQAEKFFTRP